MYGITYTSARTTINNAYDDEIVSEFSCISPEQLERDIMQTIATTYNLPLLASSYPSALLCNGIYVRSSITYTTKAECKRFGNK
jgi:hypothetical protein